MKLKLFCEHPRCIEHIEQVDEFGKLSDVCLKEGIPISERWIVNKNHNHSGFFTENDIIDQTENLVLYRNVVLYRKGYEETV